MEIRFLLVVDRHPVARAVRGVAGGGKEAGARNARKFDFDTTRNPRGRWRTLMGLCTLIGDYPISVLASAYVITLPQPPMAAPKY